MAKYGGTDEVLAEISRDRESSFLLKCHDMGHVLAHCGWAVL